MNLTAQLDGRIPLDAPRVRQALQAGPWCWPWDHPRRLERATEIAGPPVEQAATGVFPFVTEVRRGGQPVGGELWIAGQPKSRGHTHAALGQHAQGARSAAAAALPRALPYLVARPHRWDRRIHHLARFAFVFDAGQNSHALPVVDGPSFGLGWLLGLASCCASTPVPRHVIASATIDAAGKLGRVGGVERKLRVIDEWALGITHVYVAAEQVDEWRAAARGLNRSLEIVGCEKASELHLLIGGRTQIEDMPSDRRGPWVRSMFNLAADIGGRTDWHPVDRATELAMETWGDELDEHPRWQLHFANAVAARHENRHVKLELPPAGFLESQSLAPPMVAKVIANLIAHSTDIGSPPAQDVLTLSAHWKDEHPKLERTARVIGAEARLWSRVGKFERALAMQRQVAQDFARSGDFTEISFQLTEWYRLAGCMGAPAGLQAFREADDFVELHQALEHGGEGRDFVNLCRARACIQLGLDDQETVDSLTELTDKSSTRHHLRYSAMRWLARLFAVRGQRERRRAVVADLEVAADEGPAPDQAGWFLRLVRLDQAISKQRREDAQQLVYELSQPFGPIVDAARSVTDDPSFIAETFPY
jgi:hypothetical protein